MVVAPAVHDDDGVSHPDTTDPARHDRLTAVPPGPGWGAGARAGRSRWSWLGRGAARPGRRRHRVASRVTAQTVVLRAKEWMGAFGRLRHGGPRRRQGADRLPRPARAARGHRLHLLRPRPRPDLHRRDQPAGRAEQGVDLHDGRPGRRPGDRRRLRDGDHQWHPRERGGEVRRRAAALPDARRPPEDRRLLGRLRCNDVDSRFKK